MENINLYLKTQESIPFYNICKIHQSSFKEILDYGIEDFEKLLLPYYITIDSLSDEITEEEKQNLTNFELVCSSQDSVEFLFLSLEFFCKCKIDVDKDGFIFEGCNGRLNKNNFDEFAEIILKICGRERVKKEKVPEFKNDRQKDIWQKLQEGRKRNAKNNEIKMEDIINYCEFGGRSYIPIEEIKKWTIWRIMNCYNSIIGTSAYNDSFRIYLVSGEKSLIENKHWTDLLKLNYKFKE